VTERAAADGGRALPGPRRQLESGEIADRPELAASFAELNELMGLEQIEAIERRFLTAAQRDRRGAAEPPRRSG